jgi:hypothetical protein
MFSQVLIAALTLAASGLAFWIASRLRRDAKRSHAWPVTEGRILSRGIEMMQTDGRSFTPCLKYAFTVDGKEYVGAQVYRTGRVGRLKDAAQRFVDRLPEAIPVHYNPQNPTEAYLLTEPAGIFWITLCVGIFALIWGLLQVLTIVVQ